MGIPTFNLRFYKDPELIHDMIYYWEYFTVESIRPAVGALKDKIDLAGGKTWLRGIGLAFLRRHSGSSSCAHHKKLQASSPRTR